MAISLQYKGLNEINGSLVVLDNIPDASFDELVELKLDNGATRSGARCGNRGGTGSRPDF